MWHDRLQIYDIANTVRTHTHRLTVYLDEQGTEMYVELFDYEKDLHETTSFANDSKYESIMNEMRDLLKTWWENCLPDMSSCSGEIPSFR